MIEIERLEADRWQTYRDIRLAALAEAPHAFASKLETERGFDEDAWRRRLAERTQFIALVDGQPLGTVGCRLEVDTPTELISMWVAPQARRLGVASHLVRAVVAEARSRGSGTIRLWVSEGNVAAERLYADLGFVRTGDVQAIDDSDPSRGSEFELYLPLGPLTGSAP